MRWNVVAPALVLCSAGLVSCTFETQPPTDDPSRRQTVTLHRLQDGDLEFCDANGVCSSVPNPNGCAVLELKIDPQTGAACETCFDANGQVASASCEETSIGCAIVTLPEPDCVVCAYVNGAVIFSSCVVEEPRQCERYTQAQDCDSDADCGFGGGCNDEVCWDGALACINGVCGGTYDCERCFGPDGSIVSDTCAPNCSNVDCARPECGPNERYIQYPGECCGSCVPVSECDDVVCAEVMPVMECPDGHILERDPANCCGYICTPADCSAVMCPAVMIECPEGTHLDYSYPSCCGTCVADEVSCYSSADCGADQTCTTEAGECRPSPGCDANMACPTVCTGVCVSL